MDQKSDIPEIKPEVNREEKKSGVLAGLLVRFGLGSSESVGGISAGTGVGGGMMATKAGIIGLILAGTTIAGSIGVVSYKVFGPPSSDNNSDFTTLFQAKPKAEASANSKDEDKAQAGGVSSSLDSLVKANANERLFSQDKPGQEPAASTTPPLKNDNAPSQGPAAKFKAERKFGDLSKGVGTGSSGGGAGSSATSGRSSALLAGTQGLGGLTGSGAHSGAKTMGIQRRAGPDAMSQLNQGYKDYRGGNLTDYEKGRIYTGADVAKGTHIRPADLGGPAGAALGAASQNTPANPAANAPRFPPPAPTEDGQNVTPWQSAMTNAYMLIMAALALLYLASTIQKGGALGDYAYMMVAALAVAAATLAAYVIILGRNIGSGPFAQPLQGGILTAAGGALIAAATFVAWGAFDTNFGTGTTKGLSGGFTTLMYVCGGVAALGVVGSFLMPKQSYSPSMFQEGKPPDQALFSGPRGYNPP